MMLQGQDPTLEGLDFSLRVHASLSVFHGSGCVYSASPENLPWMPVRSSPFGERSEILGSSLHQLFHLPASVFAVFSPNMTGYVTLLHFPVWVQASEPIRNSGSSLDDYTARLKFLSLEGVPSVHPTEHLWLAIRCSRATIHAHSH